MSDSFDILRAQPCFRVSDINAAHTWYTNLGFVETYRAGDTHLVMTSGNVTLHLSTEEGGAAACQFVVSNVEALHRMAATHELEVLYPIGDRPWGARDFTLRDPWRNELTFSQPVQGQ